VIEGKSVAIKILFIVNTPKFFLSHRFPIACVARDAGSAIKEIIDLGFAHHRVGIARRG